MNDMTVIELYEFFEKRIPKSLSEDWDNDGLMVCPDKNDTVKGVLFSLDASEGAIEYAHQNGYNVIVTHHPLIFNKISELSGDSATSALAIKALLYKISVMSFHTRLDSVDFGVNQVLAEKIGLNNISLLEEGVNGGSIGRVGECGPQDLEGFCQKLKKDLGIYYLTVAKGSETVRKVAVVGGAGDDYIFKAADIGVDTFITGEVHHHIFMLAKSLGINIIAAGHHSTENPVLEALAKILDENFNNSKFDIYDSNPTFSV